MENTDFLLVIGIMGILFASMFIVSSQPLFSINIEDWNTSMYWDYVQNKPDMNSSYSFIIYSSNNIYYAKNSENGYIKYSSNNLTHIVVECQNEIGENNSISLFFKKGSYIFDSSGFPILCNSVNIFGEGINLFPDYAYSQLIGGNATILELSDNANHDLIYNPDTIMRALFLSNIMLYGNKQNNSYGNGININYIDLGSHNKNGLNNVVIADFKENGIYSDVGGLSHISASGFTISSCGKSGINSTAEGIEIGAPNWIVRNELCGVYQHDCNGMFGELYLEDSGTYGYHGYNIGYGGQLKIFSVNNNNTGVLLQFSNNLQFILYSFNNAYQSSNTYQVEIDTCKYSQFTIQIKQGFEPSTIGGLALKGDCDYTTILPNIYSKGYAIGLSGLSGNILIQKGVLHGDNGVVTGVIPNGLVIENQFTNIKMGLTKNQYIENNVQTTVTFNQTEYDALSEWSSNTFTAKYQGYYSVYVETRWVSNMVVGSRYVTRIYSSVNGRIGQTDFYPSHINTQTVQVFTSCYLNVGSTVYFTVQQVSGAGAYLQTDIYATKCVIIRIG